MMMLMMMMMMMMMMTFHRVIHLHRICFHVSFIKAKLIFRAYQYCDFVDKIIVLKFHAKQLIMSISLM